VYDKFVIIRMEKIAYYSAVCHGDSVRSLGWVDSINFFQNLECKHFFVFSLSVNTMIFIVSMKRNGCLFFYLFDRHTIYIYCVSDSNSCNAS